MKKLLLTLIAVLAFGGSIFAQESHWADFNFHDFDGPAGIVAYVQIGEEFVNTTNYEQYEVAAFVGDVCRGHSFLFDGTDYGDLYPTIDMQVYYNFTKSAGEVLTFKLFDGENEYDIINCYEYLSGDALTLKTGEDHQEIWDDPEDGAIVLQFPGSEVPAAIEKTIISYNEEDGGWYLISSPVGNVPVADVENITSNTYDLYYFNQEQENEWINYQTGGEVSTDAGFASVDGKLMAGKGYLYANSETVTLKFYGDAYTETGTFTLDYFTTNADRTMHGMNLVGNPFNEAVTVDRPFYRMIENELQPFDESYEEVQIEPMEGIIVCAEAEGESVTFTPATATGGKGASLALNLTNGGKVIDRAIVGFGQGARLPKLQLNPNSSKVYFNMDNRNYAVVRSEGMGEMPVSFKAESNGTYSLTLSTQNAEFSYLHLIDNLTGADQDLLVNPSYSFNANTTDYASRFRLVFATDNDEDSFAFFSNGNLVISNEGNATLQVVDVTGRIIKCENINGCASVSIDAAPGVYMVRLVNGDNVKVQKVVK